MKTGYAVVGLGRFGMSVARTLTGLGKSVLAIDARPDVVQNFTLEVDGAVSCDTTDEEALAELNLEKYEAVVVGIGASSIENSILTTALLNQQGVDRIIARAIHDLHGRVLRAVGAHEIVNPEAEIGVRLAERLATPSVLEQFALGDDAVLAEVEAPAQFTGRSLVELDVRNKYDLSILAVKRGEEVLPSPRGTELIMVGDILVVIGKNAPIRRLANLV